MVRSRDEVVPRIMTRILPACPGLSGIVVPFNDRPKTIELESLETLAQKGQDVSVAIQKNFVSATVLLFPQK